MCVVVCYGIRDGGDDGVDEDDVAVFGMLVGDGCGGGGMVDPVEEDRRFWWIWRHFNFY